MSRMSGEDGVHIAVLCEPVLRRLSRFASWVNRSGPQTPERSHGSWAIALASLRFGARRNGGGSMDCSSKTKSVVALRPISAVVTTHELTTGLEIGYMICRGCLSKTGLVNELAWE
ncbi:hypothetical protein E4U50_006941 [Claviceps purpurea]|nr:hypothetical protein E4U50_006941 [Claviceps purpurea]